MANSPVICNFRKNDLLNGGNGAPIMPDISQNDSNAIRFIIKVICFCKYRWSNQYNH